MEINLGKVWAVEEPHGHVGGDGRPHGQGVDGHGDGDQLGDGLGVVEGPHVHVGVDGRPTVLYHTSIKISDNFCFQGKCNC